MAKVAMSVHVTDDNGLGHWFHKGDEVPDALAQKITNPLAWEGEPADSQAAAPSGGGGTVAGAKTQDKQDSGEARTSEARGGRTK